MDEAPHKFQHIHSKSASFGRMSWLDPDRLAALYGKKPLKRAEQIVVDGPPVATAPAPKVTKKEKKAAKKAAKKARKQLEKLAKKQQEAPIKVSTSKKSKCCKKYKKGKQCDDCPLARMVL